MQSLVFRYGTAHVQVYSSCCFLLRVFVNFIRGTSQILHATHELKNWIVHANLNHVRENLMCLVTRSETRATESSLDSTRHATQLSDCIHT